MKRKSKSRTKSVPINKSLYNRIKNKAKHKFKVYPSVYANSWVVREYKKAGGRYKSKTGKKSGLSRWYREKWIDVCKYPKIVPCGRKSKKKSNKNYPYCRPLYKINKKTPKTVKQFSLKQLKKRCSKKRKNPNKKIY
jgi:hypothetical protein